MSPTGGLPLVHTSDTNQTHFNQTHLNQIKDGAQSAPPADPPPKKDWVDCVLEHQHPGEVDLADFPEGARPVIQAVCRLWNLTPPQRSKKKGGEFALWINDAYYLADACGELGLDVLRQVRKNYEADMARNNGAAPYTVGRPGALIKVARATAGQMRGARKAPPTSLEDLNALRAQTRARIRAAQEKDNPASVSVETPVPQPIPQEVS